MAASPSDLIAQAKAEITECSVTDVETGLDSGTVLVDVREPVEFRRGCIAGAVNLPRGLLEFDIRRVVAESARVPETAVLDCPVVVYCGTGARSALAAKAMQDMGFTNVSSMAGGIVAWAEADGPVTTPE